MTETTIAINDQFDAYMKASNARIEYTDEVMDLLQNLAGKTGDNKPPIHWLQVVSSALRRTGPRMSDSPLDEKEVAAAEVSKAFLDKLVQMLKEIPILHWHIRDDAGNAYLSKLKTMMYMQERKLNKIEKDVNVALLTPGTVIKHDLKSIGGEHYTKLPETFTVKAIHPSGPGHFIIETVEELPSSISPYDVESVTFSNGFITQVIKHVPGRLHIKERNDGQRFYDQGTVSKTRYKIDYVDYFVRQLIGKLQLVKDPDCDVDTRKLSGYLLESRLLQRVFNVNEERWHDPEYTVNKKRVHRFMKQNINRFLITKKEQLRIEKEYQESMYSDLDLD